MAINAESITFGPWTTVDYSVPAVDLAPDVLAEMKNVELDDAGSIKTRKGYTKYISSALSSTPSITGCGKQRFSTSSSAVFVFAGDKFYEDASGTWTDRTGSQTITAANDNTFISANAAGTLIATNGVDTVKKWTAAGGNLAALGMGSSSVTRASAVAWWDNRAWLINTNQGERRAHYSSNTDIEAYGANDYFQTDGAITGAGPVKSFFALHNDDAIYGLFPTGNADTPYSIQRRADRGTVARRSVVMDEYGNQVFVRRDGIYIWDGSNPPIKISGNFDGSEFWDNVIQDRLQHSFAVENRAKNQVIFALPYGTNQVLMNKYIVWNYKRQQWVGVFEDFTRICAAYFNDSPHFGGSGDGLLYVHDSGTNDNTTAIKSFVSLAATPPISLAEVVRWLYARHEFEAAETDYEINVQQRGPSIVSRTDGIGVGDPSDAIETEFIIKSSSIRGSTTAYVLDTDMWGYDPVTQLKYTANNKDEPMALRRALVMFKPVGKRTKRQLGVE